MFDITIRSANLDFEVMQNLANNPIYGRTSVTVLTGLEYGYTVQSNWIESIMCIHGVIIGKKWRKIQLEVVERESGEVMYEAEIHWV